MVALATLFVVWNLSPWSWFTDTTPTGGDMGAHVWSPAYLRDELLPNLRLTGWSPDWYAGFPAFTFYMVVPSLLIVIVNVGVDIGVGLFAFLGLALGAAEAGRRLGLAREGRLAAVVGISGLGLALGSFADGDRIDPGFLGWAPIEPFVYNDRSIDLAVATVVWPIAVAAAVWRLAPGLGRWRGATTSAAVVLAYLLVPVPYGVAMKLVVVAGMVTLPMAAFLAGRIAGLAYPAPAMLAVMTLPFVFDRSHNIYGGNLMSTMAGEFAFSLGLSFAVVYLGVVARGLRTGRDLGVA
ncbi:MAG: hypothetical protein GWN79_10190, partial [Actinobacteria bacterium]|nr:hypothetical protein [Actinomycetota bacterium]NIS31517.1 hypothetical protein [Actinomycetota bacterium]NIT95745.1 hypothetical protein [Actinomycetota bacterium]NIU19429.1 hypothetical protein [Actinomycetota bacterium]NIU66631.1 hypothetical protein [Actinomycetota bacterium]